MRTKVYTHGQDDPVGECDEYVFPCQEIVLIERFQSCSILMLLHLRPWR